MSVIRCPQGHYYDDQRFSRCPHCGITSGASGSQAGALGSSGHEAGEGKTRSLFGWLDREKTVAFGHRKHTEAADAQKGSAAAASGVPGGPAVPVSSLPDGGPKVPVSGLPDDDRTVAMSVPGLPDGDHTIALAAAPLREDDQRTISFYSGAKGNDYVTGWLVCVAGPEKGRDYRLHHGFNRIGRDMEMDVQVMDDPAVSRKNHGSIVYDAKSRMFSLVPSPGALTYYKGELLEQASCLQAGDEIQMGNSVFVFIPFCGEDRVWEE